MAKLIPAECIPLELQSKINIVKKRILFLSPSVASGHEHEPCKDDFEPMTKENIGAGGFGKVYKVRHKTSQNVYAIKVISKKKIIEGGLNEQIKLEVRIMYSLNHEHIIKLYNHFEDDEFFYLVLELATKGQLYDKLKAVGRFTEAVAAQYMREAISAVQYLHSLSPPIIHRDIKPENILLDTKEAAKLCDFGWSNFFNPQRARMTYCGTPDYLSPEMIKQEGHDQRLDIWNLGVLLFEMLTGRPPFQGANQRELYDNILKLKIRYPKDFPRLAQDLVTKLLKVNPKERLSLSEALEHAWIKGRPEIRPVLTRQVTLKGALPTLEQALGDDDFEPVSKISKINREEEKMTVPSLICSEDTESPTKSKIESEKDMLIEDLNEKLKAVNKELNDKKVQLDNTISEAKALKMENEELKKHFGESGNASKEKEEMRRLNDELKKCKAINKDRENMIIEVEKSKDALTESLTSNKIQGNTIEVLRSEKTSLLEKLAEIQARCEKMEKKYAVVKQKLGETENEKEKTRAELEASIHELQYSLPAKASPEMNEEGTNTFEAEILESCKKSLTDLQEKVKTELSFKKQVDEANSRLVAEQARYNELKTKYDTEMREYQAIMARSAEEVRKQCEEEKRKDLEQQEAALKDMAAQLAQAKEKEVTTTVEHNKTKSGQMQFAQLNRVLTDMRLQVLLYGKEQKYLREMLNSKENVIQDLKFQMGKDRGSRVSKPPKQRK